MRSDAPAVSVVVPSHNRCGSLRRMLEALGRQTYSPSRFEVVVVADGCRDGTAEMLRRYQAPFRLRSVDLAGLGAAAARNRGAAEASGSLLIFLDDDIEPVPGLVEAHVSAHGGDVRRVAIGYLCSPSGDHGTLCRIGLRAWWESQFLAMRQAGHRFTYRDVLSGNFSLSSALFERVGGFDVSLPRREDYELGFRLVKAEVSFAYVAAARGCHHDESDHVGLLRRAYDEGRGDVLVGRRHPELRPDLPLFHFREPRGGVQAIVHTLAFESPRFGDAVARWLAGTLPLLEGLRLRGGWRRLFAGLRDYWYLRGAVRELGSQAALDSFAQGGPARIHEGEGELAIDLGLGLSAAERRLDQERPAEVRLHYREQFVGRIPAQIGAERLRGAHLRPMLATALASSMLNALIIERATRPEPPAPWPSPDPG